MSSDEELDRAIVALRDAQTPPLPPRLESDTLGKLRRGRRRTNPRALVLKLAAAVVICVGGVALYRSLSPSWRPVMVGPTTTRPETPLPSAAPSSQQAVPTPAPPLVENGPPRPPSPASRVVVAGTWSISGTVRFEGEAPETQQIDMSAVRECAAQHPDGAFEETVVVNDGKLANVVVWVRPEDVQGLPATPPPRDAAVLDQKGCQYSPHVLAVQVGQPIAVRNSDAFLHNVHAMSIDNPSFNFGQPTKDPGRKAGPMMLPEVFKVKCDVHPWMTAFVHVIEHRFFAVTREDGTYQIPPGLRDGRYVLIAWHEKLGRQEVLADVKDGKAEGADFAFRTR